MSSMHINAKYIEIIELQGEFYTLLLYTRTHLCANANFIHKLNEQQIKYLQKKPFYFTTKELDLFLKQEPL